MVSARAAGGHADRWRSNGRGGEFTNRWASSPKRAMNFLQPVPPDRGQDPLVDGRTGHDHLHQTVIAR